MSNDAKRQAVTAAMSLAEDITAGKLSPEELDAVAVEECRELFGRVEGPDDPLWDLHVDVARQVLGLDGIPVDELAEWVAVARHVAGADAEPSWIERALAQFDDEGTESDVSQA